MLEYIHPAEPLGGGFYREATSAGGVYALHAPRESQITRVSDHPRFRSRGVWFDIELPHQTLDRFVVREAVVRQRAVEALHVFDAWGKDG